MADITYQPETRTSFQGSNLDWSAIWAGLFTFISIWSVFGLLGYAIFASAAAQPMRGASIGVGIWAVILMIVAMYIAGRATGRLAGLDGRSDALIHGLVMFGLSVSAVLVLTMSGRLLFISLLSANRFVGANLPGILGHSGWFAFFALFLGWLAAMGGAVSGVKPKAALPSNVRDMRPAA
ncbi:MAG: hypothetical protein WBW53_22560 [Terriglobales bacterium]